MISMFTRDENGLRPIYGDSDKFQNDPHWRDLNLYYEYFHGDNGTGIGASHQTGWTGCIAKLIYMQSIMSEEYWMKPGPLKRLAQMQPI
jgi:hypothetical protein